MTRMWRIREMVKASDGSWYCSEQYDVPDEQLEETISELEELKGMCFDSYTIDPLEELKGMCFDSFTIDPLEEPKGMCFDSYTIDPLEGGDLHV